MSQVLCNCGISLASALRIYLSTAARLGSNRLQLDDAPLVSTHGNGHSAPSASATLCAGPDLGLAALILVLLCEAPVHRVSAVVAAAGAARTIAPGTNATESFVVL
jgi:hypothetical protein